MSANAVLRKYFGNQPGQTLSEFIQEAKKLSAKDKQELAEIAAKELGVTLDS